MPTVDEHILAVDAVICQNIALLGDNRNLLSQNILSQLRDLLEGVAVRLHTNTGSSVYSYNHAITPALEYIRARGQYSFLRRFHDLLQISASHYTFLDDGASRLMLKYYDYLLRIRQLAETQFGLSILANLEDFPVELEPSLAEFYRKIRTRVLEHRAHPDRPATTARYYVHRTRPFFVDGAVLYEVTFTTAYDNAAKSSRIIAFTDIDIANYYAANLTLVDDAIEVLGQRMPILIVRDWGVSIRPCEIDNFARILGRSTNARSGSLEYQRLMSYLTATKSSLLDLVDLQDKAYSRLVSRMSNGIREPRIMALLDASRRLILSGAPGTRLLRYLLLQLNNRIIKEQYWREPCARLSDLKVSYGCIPFDTMPFCTSLKRHNPRMVHLLESLDVRGREHELLARTIKRNVEARGIIYTPVSEVEHIGELSDLILRHNRRIYVGHPGRKMVSDRGHVFIAEYEEDAAEIIRKLQNLASAGLEGYASSIEQWLASTNLVLDDDLKRDALRRLFNHSKVALIYGAAGTGKSTMVNYIANHFGSNEKLFLAHTNPAVDNLRRRVDAQHCEFRTIASHLRGYRDASTDVLFIDECSTVGNADLLDVLEKTEFRLLVLVGDVYQIESIQFGNWFGIARSFLPASATFELQRPYRTTMPWLLDLWSKVRSVSQDIGEAIAHHGCSSNLDESIFETDAEDSIILCLNYDGLYDINNINRFLQARNEGKSVKWEASIYKVGDPILFNETERFGPTIYNNLKGTIVDFERFNDRIQFDVRLNRPLTEMDVDGFDLRWVSDGTVQFDVFRPSTTDSDDEPVNTVVPFQVAYAVSIHKAQGLEYDSVKVVITDANEEDITHSIFYTAITRARTNLRLYWTPETQNAVLSRLEPKANNRDVRLLQGRTGLVPSL